MALTSSSNNQYSFTEDAIPRLAPVPAAGIIGQNLTQPTVPEVSLLVDNLKLPRKSQGSNTGHVPWNRNTIGKSVTFQSDLRQTFGAPSSSSPPLKPVSSETYRMPEMPTQIPFSETTEHEDDKQKLNEIFCELLAQGKHPPKLMGHPTLSNIYTMLKDTTKISNTENKPISNQIPTEMAENNKHFDNFKKSTEIALNKMRRRATKQLNDVNRLNQELEQFYQFIETNFKTSQLNAQKSSTTESSESDTSFENNNYMEKSNQNTQNQNHCGYNHIAMEQNRYVTKNTNEKSHKKHAKNLNKTAPTKLNSKTNHNKIYSHNKTVSMCPDHCKHAPPPTNRSIRMPPKHYSDCSHSESESDHVSECSHQKYQHNQRQSKCGQHNDVKQNKKKTYNKSMKSANKCKNIRQIQEMADDTSEESVSDECNTEQSMRNGGDKRSAENSKRADLEKNFYGNILGQVNDVLQNSPTPNETNNPKTPVRPKPPSETIRPQYKIYQNEASSRNSPTDRSLLLETLKQKYLDTNQFIDNHIDSRDSPEFSIGTYKYMKKYTLLPGSPMDHHSNGSRQILMEEMATTTTTPEPVTTLAMALNRTTPVGRARGIINQRRLDNIDCSQK